MDKKHNQLTERLEDLSKRIDNFEKKFSITHPNEILGVTCEEPAEYKYLWDRFKRTAKQIQKNVDTKTKPYGWSDIESIFESEDYVPGKHLNLVLTPIVHRYILGLDNKRRNTNVYTILQRNASSY